MSFKNVKLDLTIEAYRPVVRISYCKANASFLPESINKLGIKIRAPHG